MKYIKATVVVLLIFALPAGSYLYLRSGFIYRLETLKLLENKTELNEKRAAFVEKYNPEIYTKLNSGVTIFQRVKDEQDKKDLYFLAESLEPRTDFHVVAFTDSIGYSMIDDTIYSRGITRMQTPTRDIDAFFGEERFLLAKDSFLRMEYGYTEQEMLDVYEHAVVLLPMKKKDKVKLVRKRGN